MEIKNDFSKGSIEKNILNMAIPMIVAQLVNVLYNIVDRLYISKMPEDAFIALTGLGVCLPIITMVIAFSNLFGMGGAPLCSIERGRGNLDEAEKIMGNSFVMLIFSGIILTITGLIFKKPLLYAFGASDITFPYANQYISIYMIGNIFVTISLGMNNFINSQGFGRIGMMTVLFGAISNIILDPIFIFVFNMGVKGAALATIISQFFSAVWVLRFLTGKKAILKLKRSSLKLRTDRILRIVGLGTSGFVMQFTNFLVQVAFNSSLQLFGGDIYVGIMTVLNSVREIFIMPVSGLTSGSQPVIGFNYGAHKYDRVIKSIKFITIISVGYTALVWILILAFPRFFISIFNKDPDVLEKGIPAMRILYLMFFTMAFQFAGQAAFVALGKAKFAVFFSTFRKVIIVVPLVLILPRLWGLGIMGVFLAEPISDFIGGLACYITMFFTVRKDLREKSLELEAQQISDLST